MLNAQKLAALGREAGGRTRRDARVSLPLIIKALVLHAISDMGSLADHLFSLDGTRVSDSALSQRRGHLPFTLFERILAVALRPRANAKAHPQAFYHGLRLVGIDGTEFSVGNTPAIVAALGKAASRRFSAAFAKLSVCLLVELGAHNPLSCAIGQAGEKEYALARRLLTQLPVGCLLLADRFYGVGAFLSELRLHWPKERGHFLVRARANLAPKFLEALGDGSALVELSLRETWRAPGSAKRMRVREIQGRVRRAGGAWTSVRLYTSLLDEKVHPAKTLLELYARRWEHELAYKELKLELRSTPLLASHTPESAAQEIAALVLGQSLLAEARLAAAVRSGLADPLSISFAKLHHGLEGLIHVAALAQAAGTPLSAEQWEGLWKALCQQLFWRRRKGPRRARSCARAVRQPVQSWPRLVQTSSHTGAVVSEVLPIKPPSRAKKPASNQR